MEWLASLDEGILGRSFFGATVGRWTSVLAVWAVVSLALLLLRALFADRLLRFAERTRTQVDDYVAVAVRGTRTYTLLAAALYAAVLLVGLPEPVVQVVGRVAFLLLVFQAIQWGNTLITTWIDRSRQEKLGVDASLFTTIQAVGFMGRVLLWTLALLVALDNIGVDVTALVAGLGVGGIAVALAVQNILGDLFASLSIVLDKPFVIGDALTVGEFSGTVEHIGLKTTRLRSVSGEQIIFSNSDLLASRIRNHERMYERRVAFTLGVVYETDPDLLERLPGLLREVVEGQDHVRFERAHFQGYGDSALRFEVVYFVLSPDYNLFMDIQQAINLAIYRRAREAGLAFAYPTQTLHLEPVKTEVVERRQMMEADGA